MKRLRHYISTMLALTAIAINAQTTPVSQMEKLDRGVIALKPTSGGGNFVSWRFLGTDDEDNTTFDVLRNGIKIANNLYKTNYKDGSGTNTSQYQIVTNVNGVPVDTTDAVVSWGNVFRTMTLQRPATGAQGGNYEPNDMSVGDVDGDGQYELFVKWQPDNSKDNSQSGITDNTIIDCYSLKEIVNGQSTTGQLLWRIDLGPNIRSGAHYTQFMVYDFNGDGRAEMMCKTGPGSKDGNGEYVNKAATDTNIKNASGTAIFRNSGGRITGGQEWLTVFDGQTGSALHTIFYNPNRNMTYGGAADGSVNWGVGGKNDTGSYGNRGERYLAAVAYLGAPSEGDATASAIFCRGYYDYAFIWAVDFDGQQLHQRWLSSHKAGSNYSVTTYDATGKGTSKSYSGCKPTSGSGSGTMYQNGNHNMSIADVDGDGYDEIVWGSAALDNDGTLLYGTGYGHGDAIHVADHCPDRPGFEVFQIHEGGSYGWDLHDALTGEIIHSATGGSDNGRGIAGQFDAKVRGSLFWSSNDGSARSAVSGYTVSANHGSSNFRIYWDGDLQEELFDGGKIDKWNGNGTDRLYLNGRNIYDYNSSSTCNGSKSTPCLQADIFGDWREELILWSSADATTLNIFTTNTESAYRIPTLMHDHTYRMGICWQNTAYNQPPHLGYYLPDAMLPCLIGDKEFTVNVGAPFEYVARGRYTKTWPTITCPKDDGTSSSTMPAGITRNIDVTNKITTLQGAFEAEGDYLFYITLKGLADEKVTDTITVHVLNAQDGIQDIEFSEDVYDNEQKTYDLQGRQTTYHRHGLYIVRKNGRTVKVMR